MARMHIVLTLGKPVLKTMAERLSAVLTICCALFALPTALCSCLVTVTSDYGEWVYTYSLSDSFVVVAAAAIFLMVVCGRPLITLLRRIGRSRLYLLLILYAFFASLLWVFIADVWPEWDSRALVDSAQSLEDPSSMVWWQDGGYIERFPYQIPMILILYVCRLVAGSQMVLFFEVLNCIAAATVAYLVVRITEVASRSANATCIAVLITVMTLPIYFYATFIYGNGICMPFCLGAFLMQMKGFSSNSPRRHILAAVLACIGVLIKSSMMLVLVAMAVVWVVSALKHRAPLLAGVAVAAFILNTALSSGVLAATSRIVPTNLHNGLPSTTWIVMGLGANTSKDAAFERHGTNNDYVWAILDNEYSPEQYSEMNATYLAERFNDYVHDPVWAVKYFASKYLLEWSDPLYGSLGASNWSRALPDHSAMTERTYTALAPHFYYGRGNRLITIVCDTAQLITIGGAAVFSIAARRKTPIELYAPFLYAAGGALFYLFWEAKSQYILPFYIALIPYAALGVHLVVQRLRSNTETVGDPANDEQGESLPVARRREGGGTGRAPKEVLIDG